MKSLLFQLLKLNDALYNWPCQLLITLLWVSVLSFSHLSGVKYWIYFGLVFWVLLFAFRIFHEGLPPKPKTRRELLGYLVGLNIPAVLGPLSIPLVYLLAYS